MLIICSMIYLKKRNKKYATVVQCRSIHPPYCGWDAWSIYQDPLLKPKYQFKSFYFTIFNLCKCAYLILQCIHWCFSSIESLECGRVFLVSYSIDKHTLRYALHLHVNKQRQFVKIVCQQHKVHRNPWRHRSAHLPPFSNWISYNNNKNQSHDCHVH